MTSGVSELSPVLGSALLDEEDIDRVTYVVRNLALSSGFDALNANLLAAATSELATNAVVHGGGGRFSVGPTTDGRGLEIVISDDGPGIDDIERAFVEGYSTRQGGLGIGLSAVRRAATNVDVRSAPGRGTTVTMRHFLPPPRVWLELGIGSRPDPTSEENGGLVVHRGLPNDQLLVAIVDSLDRGPRARARSTVAAEVLCRTKALDPGDMLHEAHRAVRQSDDDDGHNGLIATALVADRHQLTLAAIGDMTTRIFAKDGTEPLSFDMCSPAASARLVQPTS